MKKVLAFFLSILLILTAFPIHMVSAGVQVTVIADEGWSSATYDSATGELKNISEGYSFKATFSGTGANASATIGNFSAMAQKMVVPSKITYNGTTYSVLTVMGTTIPRGDTIVKEVILSEGLRDISSSAFRDAKGLQKITFPSTLKSIGSNAFLSCTALSDISPLPEGLTTISSQAFGGCQFTEITIPSTVTSFDGSSMFSGCSKLINPIFNITLTNIPSSMFRNCSSLTSFEIPKTVTGVIGNLAFSGSAITEVVIPSGVTALGTDAFSNCKRLNSVTVGGQIDSIGAKAFSGDSALKTLVLRGKTAPTIENVNAFTGVDKNLIIYYPSGSTGYEVDSDFRNAILTSVPNATFVVEERPTANVSITNKYNIGDVLTGTYTYTEPFQNAEETDSICYWQSSDDISFTDFVNITEQMPINSAQTSQYTIKQEDTGKFIRFCVIPKSEGGFTGEIGISNMTDKINVFEVTLSTTGATVGTLFDCESNLSTYRGSVKAVNTTLEEENITLVSAWYITETSELKDVYINKFIVPSNTQKTFSGDGRTIKSIDELETLTLKVFALNNTNDLKPLATEPLKYEGVYDPSAELARYEAEDGVLTGRVAVKSDAKYSGGKYVSGFVNDSPGDTCTFNIKIEKAGHYDFTFMTAGDGGSKINYVAVDGVNIGELRTPSTALTNTVMEKNYLTSGEHNVTVSGFWGYIFLDYLEISKSTSFDTSIFDVSDQLINPNATDYTKSLMKYLTSIYGKQILSGQTCDGGITGNEFMAIKILTNKYPAVLSMDMMDYSPSRVAHGTTGNSIQRAIDFDRQGGINTMCWHWNAPERYLYTNDSKHPWYSGFYTQHVRDLDLAAIMADETSEAYLELVSDIDAIAIQLKRLQDAGVPVLWRPLHEASGEWFWWGSAGPDAYKKLWKLMYDRMTNYHELNNLIWVYNGQSADWYPGDEYVDIIGEDIYPGTKVYSSQINKFNEATAYSDSRKIVALTENGCLFDPDLAVRDNAMWMWFAPWGGEYVIKSNTISEEYTEKYMFTKVYNHEKVITLDELPDWKNY